MMAYLPRVTIVTPSYNQAPFLEQTILSVLGQNYPDLEYMVVDGASTDGSQDIIRKYADRLAWWVSEKDHGQGEAINKGFVRATGEIVGWLNSDDVYQPGAIAAAVEAFQARPELGLVFSDVLAIDGDNNVLNLMRCGDWGLDELMTFHILNQPGVFMKQTVLEQAGYLDPDYHYMLDTHLWLRMAQIAPMRYIRKTLAAGRFHALAKNMAAAPRFGEEALKLVAWMQTQPGLAGRFKTLARQVWAGAYRMNGRYLLDGGKPWPALEYYVKSLVNHPATALPEWHRMVYALLCLAGLQKLKPVYHRLRRLRHPRRSLPKLESFNRLEK
ncbi:MAG TPA: glycosyltransferase family 2 protein [Anaerolineaceae bacterium]